LMEDEPISLEEQDILARHPQFSLDFVRYIVTKAKVKFASQYRDNLKSELDKLTRREEGLRAAKEDALNLLLRKELGWVSLTFSSFIDFRSLTIHSPTERSQNHFGMIQRQPKKRPRSWIVRCRC